MNAISRPWNRLPVLVGVVMLVIAGVAAAAVPPAQVEARKERQAQQREERQQARQQTQQQRQQVREQRVEQRQQQQSARRADEVQRRDERRTAETQRRETRRDAAQERQARAGAQLRPGLVPRDRDERPRYDRDRDRDDSRYANRPPQRQWRTNPDGSRQYRPVPPRRYVPSLPYGYSRYSWNGRPYYYQGGSWYRPWGSSFAVVRPPVGLYVSYLPSYSTSFYYGGSRYFFADDTYYMYEPSRSTYVVTRSPYGDDDYEEEEATFDEDELYVYPAQGQSDEQQADDRYECHRWAVGETAYDPVEGDYDPDRRAQYLRALSACLTGRGYTVR